MIPKCPSLKGSRGGARRGNYLRYIGTREGVDAIGNNEDGPTVALGLGLGGGLGLAVGELFRP